MKSPARLMILAAAATAAIAGPAVSAVAAQAPAASAPMAVAGNVAPGLAHTASLGAVPASQQVHVAVSLKLRNSAQLKQFLADVANPKSAKYRHFLTPQQFLAQYGPTQAGVDQVVSHLKAAGLTVGKVSANRQVVDATGTAAQIQAAFGTQLGSYHDARTNRTFYANAAAPKLPASLAGIVQGVAGLDDHYLPHHAAATPHAGGGYGPSDLRGAYDVPSSADGSGVTVALWEFDSFSQSDIDEYDSQYGLDATTPKVEEVDGGQGSPSGGEVEVDLDIETIQGMAPGAQQIVYEAPEPSTDESFEEEEIDEANQIVSDDSASIVSMSWGMCEPERDSSLMQSADNAFQQGAAEGIGWYAASGDSGSDDCEDGSSAVDFPASDPNITGVGGTSLEADGGYGGETAWDGSGGGTSSVFDAPSYQQGDGGMRTVPDVAADADPNTGVNVISDGQSGVVGGTSLAAPLWASFAALDEQQSGTALGAANEALYGAAGGDGFHDVTSGSNGDYDAGPGYDQVTGNGSYDFSALSAALGG